MRAHTPKQNLTPKWNGFTAILIKSETKYPEKSGLTTRVPCDGNADSCISCPGEGLFARNGF